MLLFRVYNHLILIQVDRKSKGTLLPFDRTEPYMHPDSRKRGHKIKITRKQLESIGTTSESSSAPETLDKDEDDDVETHEEGPSSESYEEDEEPEPGAPVNN